MKRKHIIEESIVFPSSEEKLVGKYELKKDRSRDNRSFYWWKYPVVGSHCHFYFKDGEVVGHIKNELSLGRINVLDSFHKLCRQRIRALTAKR